MPRTPLPLLAALTALLLALALTPASPAAAVPVEDYPSYQPATRCSPTAKPGTKMLGHWLVRTYGGGYGPISRACGGSTSEHTEGRAFDWMLDATTRGGRHAAKAFLHRIKDTNRRGDTDALGRRMGIMYVIWNDHMYASYRGYDREPYLSSGCRSVKRCSTTLRHRDHVHVSLTRRAGRAQTSWYLRR